MKTIAIIGGMGPQAGLHAHKRLVDKLIENKIEANVIHVSLKTEHFFNVDKTFKLSVKHKELLWPYQS
jgi:aspartate/glutamate racemase